MRGSWSSSRWCARISESRHRRAAGLVGHASAGLRSVCCGMVRQARHVRQGASGRGASSLGAVWPGRQGVSGRGAVRPGSAGPGAVRQARLGSAWRGSVWSGSVWQGRVWRACSGRACPGMAGSGLAWQARHGVVRHGVARQGGAWLGRLGAARQHMARLGSRRPPAMLEARPAREPTEGSAPPLVRTAPSTRVYGLKARLDGWRK